VGIEGFFLALTGILTIGLLASACFLLRRQRRAGALTAAITLVIAAAWYPLPAIDQIASVLFFPHDTIYAPRYSEERFRDVRAGQRYEEVLVLLGEPLERRRYGQDGIDYWYYSRHGPRYNNYWNKIMIFDHSGRVTKKISDFYSD
jgi:outer membrane protein assembly factor BamE (lipoprotein component of BamABCDE complex)